MRLACTIAGMFILLWIGDLRTPCQLDHFQLSGVCREISLQIEMIDLDQGGVENYGLNLGHEHNVRGWYSTDYD